MYSNSDNQNYKLTGSFLNVIKKHTSGAARHKRESREGHPTQAGSGPAAVTGTKAKEPLNLDSGRLVSRINREPEDLPGGSPHCNYADISRGGKEDEVKQGAILRSLSQGI